MGLRLKILSGFLILSLMLLLAAIWAAYQLNVLGISAKRILDENYKSIHAAGEMIEALERQDSAILLLLLGRWEEGRSILESSEDSFQEALRIAQGNITISGEEAQVEAISSSYSEYKRIWGRPIVGTTKEGNLNWYTEEVHPAFVKVKSRISKLRELNDTAMYESASDLKEDARRAITPGAVAVIATLVFSLLFSYFVNYYFVTPILRITNAVHDFMKTGKPFDVQIESRDEMARLVSTINELCSAAHVSRER